MKIGVIARADDRGLGIQTWEVARHLPVERVLVVREPGAERRGFVPYLDRYPGATVVAFDPLRGGQLPQAEVCDWLEGLDVIYSAETLYDWRLSLWARFLHVATVVHANPEFYKHEVDSLDHPTMWWSATPWRLDTLHPDTRVVPMPVPTDRFDTPTPRGDGPLQVLHVAGKAAARDRAGTQAVVEAARAVNPNVHITITSQERARLNLRSRVAQMRTTVVHPGPADYWRLYDGMHVLLAPRRYGGLSLPTIEAMGAGLVPIMPNCSPNEIWPAVFAKVHRRTRVLASPTGRVQLNDVRPADIATMLNDLAADPVIFEVRRAWVDTWVRENSWDALLPVWLAELETAANMAR